MKTGNLDGQGLAELRNFKFQNLSAAPSTSLGAGRFYYSTTDNTLYVYDGTSWKDALKQGNIYTFSTGLTNTNNTVTLNAATTSALGGVKVGTNISVSSGTISVANASTSGKGVIEIATDSEAVMGTAIDLAVTPKQLATAISPLQLSSTAVTHTASTAVGSGTQPVYIASNGVATATTYSLGKSVPSDAKFTDTTYTAGTGLTLSGTQFKVDTSTVAMKSDLTTVYKAAGTVASASDLPTLAAGVLGNVYNVTTAFNTTSDFVEGAGKQIQVGNDIAVVDIGTGSTHTYKFSVMGDFVDISSKQDANTAVKHTASTAVGSATKGVYVASDGTATAMTYELNKTVPSNAVFTDTKNTAGSTDTSSKIYLVGATSQAANPQTYSHDTVYVDTNGRLHSSNPANNTSDNTVATTYFVTSFLSTSSSFPKTIAYNNPSLSPSGGVALWNVSSATENFGNIVSVHVYEVSSGDEVIPNNICITAGNHLEIELLSTSTIAAGTYMAVVIGVGVPLS